MPMMRRGPLTRYPVDWVLRQAATHHSSGGIEINAAVPMTVYFQHGLIYHAIDRVVPADATPPEEALGSEADTRARVCEILASALGMTDGWYYHDPLGHHEGHGPWQWEVDDLLVEAQSTAAATRELGPWGSAHLRLDQPHDAADITLGADAWAVVVELAGTAAARSMGARLSWSPHRLTAALEELADAGALVRPAPVAPIDAPAAPVAQPAPSNPAAIFSRPSLVTAEAPTGRSTGIASAPPGSTAPTPTPVPHDAPETRPHRREDRPRPVLAEASSPAWAGAPAANGDRRSALRRLISTLRPT